MDLISVRELFKNMDAYSGREVTIGGWVRSVRASKQFGFIVVNDGTFFTPVQVVYHDTLANFQEISKVNVGAALIVKGEVLLTPDAKQPFEIQATEVTVEGPSAGDYPMQKKRHTVEFLRTMPHLRPVVCHGLLLHLPLWSYLPGRELQHHPARRRILDDRAGNCFRRSGR